jgi:hypothetical protein
MFAMTNRARRTLGATITPLGVLAAIVSSYRFCPMAFRATQRRSRHLICQFARTGVDELCRQVKAETLQGGCNFLVRLTSSD